MTPRRLLLLLVGVAIGCGEAPTAPEYTTLPVERRTIEVSVEAAGTVEPNITVEVKSKASGEILELPVETGQWVEEGTLLLRIDQRQPRNRLAEARANLAVAEARLANAEAELHRAERLFKAGSIAESEHDDAILVHATATAEVVRERVAVENAQIELDDTDVRAPISGIVLEKRVERGQVISSPTRDVGGGTVLLQMADLRRVRLRTLVDETDIGKIRPGLRATVLAAAYPNRPFSGEVQKIEPKSVTTQNVTMFPVLISVENPDAALKPGMNAEVEIHIANREEVLAVPNAALRTDSDLDACALVLGLPEETIRRELAASRANLDGVSAGNGAPAGAEGEAADSTAFATGREYIVFVLRDGQPTPQWIRTGLTDFDWSEVESGLTENEAVLLLPSADLVRSQQRTQAFIRRFIGNGVPGMRRSTSR